jgi:hypothetical protein
VRVTLIIIIRRGVDGGSVYIGYLLYCSENGSCPVYYSVNMHGVNITTLFVAGIILLLLLFNEGCVVKSLPGWVTGIRMAV